MVNNNNETNGSKQMGNNNDWQTQSSRWHQVEASFDEVGNLWSEGDLSDEGSELLLNALADLLGYLQAVI